MILRKIKSEELLFTGEIEDDRTNTYLTLADYDWMNYILKTRFVTRELGTLKVKFEYFGVVDSEMEVEQILDGKSITYTFEFNSDIFIRHIKSYLEKHIAQWNDAYAFNGENIVVDFYNEVIEKGHVTGRVFLPEQ